MNSKIGHASDSAEAVDVTLARNSIQLKPLTQSIRAALSGVSLAFTSALSAGELPVPSSTLVTLGRADHAVSGNRMTINQYTNQAVLNWQSFNIGKENTVQFKQPSASSVALNRIFQNDPSQIFGKLSANGQVYLLNQNGFVFGRDSQVNVNTLVASTLEISDDTLQRGVTKVINQDGRAALVGTGEVYRKDAQGNFLLDANGNKQKIAINFMEGARVSTAKNGRIIAAAPSVRNEGTLTSPDGQIMMVAATDRVYLQEASGDPNLRGLLVEVKTGGDVTNAGKIVTDRGNTTLIGFAVNQQGRISANTSVTSNGSIRLLAREGGNVQQDSTGWLLQPGSTRRAQSKDDGLGTDARVTLTSGSQTQATPDIKDQAKAVDGQAQLASRIEVMGQIIRVRNDALVRAKSGEISLTATDNPVQPMADNVRNQSRIVLDPGAVLDVSGVKGVNLPMSRNVATVELRSNELRDAPLQRKGILYGQKVQVDIRKGTPLADISGALDRIARTVAERSTRGGALNLESEGGVTVDRGARLDFSGGSLMYRPGYVNTTRLIGDDGRTVDIGVANPNQHFIGLAGKISQTFKDWNQTLTSDRIGPGNGGRFERGYVEGKSAGELNIKTAVLALEGEMQALAVNGIHQRTPDQQARGGQLNIDLARTVDSTQGINFANSSAASLAPTLDTPSSLVLQANAFRQAGLSSINLTTNGAIGIGADTRVQLIDGAELTLKGGTLNLAGQVVSHGGTVTLSSRYLPGSGSDGKIVLGGDIDVSGNWNNDRPALSTSGNRLDATPLWTDGGTVSVTAQGDVEVQSTSRIDVSGGAQRTQKGTIVAGDAGGVSIAAAGAEGSDLSLKGQLSGYSVAGGKGGSLSLASDKIVIGSVSNPVGEGEPNPLVLDSSLFQRGGFADYRLTSNKSGLSVSEATQVDFKVQNRVLNASAVGQKTGADLTAFSQIELLPDIARQSGSLELNLVLNAQHPATNSILDIGAGATLSAGVGGSVKLTSDTSILMNGTLSAPAGSVALHIMSPPEQGELGFLANQGIWLGENARIDVAGTSQLLTDAQGRVSGKVLDGGIVDLQADRGFIEIGSGALIEASGTAAQVDEPVSGPYGSVRYQRQTVGSSGGQIKLTAAEGMQLLGDLDAHAGAGSGTAGGTLTVELNTINRREPTQVQTGQYRFPTSTKIVGLSQSVAEGLVANTQGQMITKEQFGRADLSADQVTAGGFSALTLRTMDKIQFKGDLNLRTSRSIDLDTPVLESVVDPVSGLGGAATVSAPYVAMGSSLVRPGSLKPKIGTGTLAVNAGLIDIRGESQLSGFKTVGLNSRGDLRLQGIRLLENQRDFQGELLTAADLTLKARQVYPATLSEFRVGVVNNPAGTLSIEQVRGRAGKVLSAGGKLNMDAPNIVQGGGLKAPMGQINLNATQQLTLSDGSLTSNSARGSIIPFGRTQGGIDWIYPLGSQNLVYAAPPEKKLVLNGKDVNMAPGAVIDTRGGGDLAAFEWLPGPGGSYDRLDPSSKGYQGSFAVLPGFGGNAAPIDPLEASGSGLRVGDSVYLSGGSGLKAGEYVLLPAHYALLKGAYLVTPQATGASLLPGQFLNRDDGARVVAGYRNVAGTSIRDSGWSGFAVERGGRAKTRSEYGIDYANQFFTAKARQNETALPYLPRDGGAIQISAQSGLALDGKVLAKSDKKGVGGRLDIAANNLNIVATADAGQTAGGAVNLTADSLNALGVSSILLGALRSETGDKSVIDVKASTVQLGQNAHLNGKDIILAAKSSVMLATGSSLKASGKAEVANTSQLNIAGDAAIVRATTGMQSSLSRSGVQGRAGSIEIAGGASVFATGAMMLDATAKNRLGGTLDIKGGSLALGAGRILLGAADMDASGLILNSEQLRTLDASELILNSGSDISLYGDVSFAAKRLNLHSAGLLGFNNSGQTARISGDDVLIDNRSGATTTRTGTGTGALEVNTGSLTLASGSYLLGGFNRIGMSASRGVEGSGTGTVTASADLDIETPYLSGQRSANTSIDASGHQIRLHAAGDTKAPTTEALGARLSLRADTIQNRTLIDLPSGGVKLTANLGSIELGQGSVIDVSGRSIAIGKAKLNTNGGDIELASQNGKLNLATGASLKLGGDKGGSLKLTVPDGSFNWSGDILAGGSRQGSQFDFVVGNAASAGNLGNLGNKLKAAGFTDALRLSASSGDWTLGFGENLSARQLALTATQGGVSIAGALLAEGDQASIHLNAAQRLQLTDTARLAAHGSDAQGGQVVLDAVSENSANLQGVSVAPGARIDVASSQGLANGQVVIRAARNGNDVAVSGDLGRSISGARDTSVEAVRTEQASGEITTAQIDGWKTTTQQYMANASAIENRLNLSGGLKAGLSISSPTDLTLGSQGWNLVDWRYGDRVGVLSLNAAGTLRINGALTDGFKDNAQGIDLGNGQFVALKDQLQTGTSWSYRLNAGQDVLLGADRQIRTGTGQIDIAAGRDVVLATAGSAIYTAGRADLTQRYGTLKNLTVANAFFGEYPMDGGDISLSAGRDVIGARTGQFFDGWMARTGNWSNNADHTGETPTAWAVALGGPVSGTQGRFEQNIGALGGGNVTVAAGHDVKELSVILPTTGKSVGQLTGAADDTNTNVLTNEVAVNGGGHLAIVAGNDVVGGTFYDGKGDAEIAAAGSIRSSDTTGMGVVLALGDSRFSLSAGDRIDVGTILNPTVINDPKSRNYFFTYSGQSGVALNTLSGDITLQNNVSGLVKSLNEVRASDKKLLFPSVAMNALAVYPGSLNASSAQGNVKIERSLVMFPSANGLFRLVAGGNVGSSLLNNYVNVTMSDADAVLLPRVSNPALSWDEANKRLQAIGDPSYIHAKNPVHSNDGNRAEIYAGGSILGMDPLLFSMPVSANIQAGADIQDVSFNLQHPDYAVSTISAGRDLRFTSPRNKLGNLINSASQISVAGPGQLLMTAGRNVDLGSSVGVTTTGNTVNSSLSGAGATVSILTGMGAKGAQFDAFARQFDPMSPKYQQLLTAYMRDARNDNGLNYTAAVSGFKALPVEQRNIFLINILFDEVRVAASKAAKSGNFSDYAGGYKAIQAMFPDAGSASSDYAGDLKLFFSKIATIAGGDINMLAPGGSVNAGLASAFAGSKSASDLGIVTQGEGAINGLVNKDFMVNQSRVFALNGGDITLWSSNGNIDAGRGAKAALSVPPPQITFDAQGNLKVIFPPSVSGSGIRTAASSVDKPGDVYLAAPKGIVDAGEAGIGGNNITIAATAVLGANNIQVSGSSSGVPSTNVSVPITPGGASAAATAATNTAEDAVNNDTNQANEKDAMAENRLNPLAVDILGYGECGVADVREGKPGCV